MPSFFVKEQGSDLILHNKYGVFSKEELESQLIKGALTIKELSLAYNLKSFQLEHIFDSLGITHRNFLNDTRVSNPTITPVQHQLFLGTLLGDASMVNPKFYKVTHGMRQLPYVYHIAECLGSYVSTIHYKKEVDAIELYTNRHDKLIPYFNRFYSHGKKKKYMCEGVIHDLEPLGLAYWYMDDGKYSEYGAYLCVGNISIQEGDNLRYTLENKFNLSTTLQNHDIDKGYYNIYIKSESRGHFFDLIDPYIIDSMRYKIVGETYPERCKVCDITGFHLSLCNKLQMSVRFSGDTFVEKEIQDKSVVKDPKQIYIDSIKKDLKLGKLKSQISLRALPSEDILRQHFEDGLTDLQIAQKYGFGRNTIAQARRSIGIPRKNYRNKKMSKEEFIERALSVHGNKYDYSRALYVNSTTKIEIICQLHGSFFQTPSQHLYGNNCPFCSGKRSSTSYFIQKSKLIHGDKYSYDLVFYKGIKNKVEVVCKTHGSFWQLPVNHIRGHGCPLCRSENLSEKFRSTIEDIINKANKVHNEKYKYSIKKIPKNNSSIIEIICKEHGSFFQRIYSHLNGNGCPKCNSSKGELAVIAYLKNKNIEYVYQKKFETCRNKRKLVFDFYLPDYNTCIEFDGEQHFKPFYKLKKSDKGIHELQKIQNNDNIKNIWCEEKGIKIIRIKSIKDVQGILDRELTYKYLVRFPCMSTKLVSASKVHGNLYNPNKVATPEMKLLIHSIEEDGVTQPVVTFYDPESDRYIVIDGFHRYTVLTTHFKCKEIPVVVLDKPLNDRMASTVRHNRARGRHQVDLMGVLVKKLFEQGWSDERIADHLGMEGEELLRLRQQIGCARLLANKEFSKSWEISE